MQRRRKNWTKAAKLRLLALLISVAIACAIGLGVGGWTAWQALDRDLFIDRTQVGSWTAYGGLANPRNNPYASAKAAQIGGLPLGLAEGFAFTATSDDQSQPLSAKCNYILSGTVPAARLWTLDAVGPDGASLVPADAPQRAIHSRAIVHRTLDTQADGEGELDGLTIAVGPEPAPGNWMRVGSDQPLTLILRLYDTQVGAGVGVREVSLPRIEKGRRTDGC